MIGLKVLWGALVVQVLLGLALLAWGLAGFPLPGGARFYQATPSSDPTHSSSGCS